MIRSFLLPMLLVWSFPPQEETKPFRSMSFEAACKAAKAEQKVVFIDFYTRWCGPCKKLDKTTWKNGAIQAWLTEKTIALKLDAEKEVALAKKYRINSYPTLLFLKPDGTEIDRLVGYKEPEDFLEEAKAALSGKDAIARAKEKLKGKEDDPMERMNYARALAQKGKKKEALAEYLWCFDHGLENTPSFTGVRLSFLLSDIDRLGHSYPDAIKALEERRDHAEKAVREAIATQKTGQAPAAWGRDSTFDRGMEVSALNRTLDENERTLKLFNELLAKGDSTAMLRQVMIRDVIDLLLEVKRYQDIVAGVGDPQATVEQGFSTYEMTKRLRSSDEHKAAMEEADASFRKHLVKEAGKYYEALVGSGKSKKATKLADRIIEFESSDETFAPLIRHAVRAGKYDAARALLQKAKAELKAEDLEEVSEAAEDIPAE